MRFLIASILVGATVAGCSSAPGSDEPRTVTTAFFEAVEAGRAHEACGSLSDATIKQLESQEKKRCSQAVTKLDYEGGTVIDVHLFVTNAKVDLSSGESCS